MIEIAAEFAAFAISASTSTISASAFASAIAATFCIFEEAGGSVEKADEEGLEPVHVRRLPRLRRQRPLSLTLLPRASVQLVDGSGQISEQSDQCMAVK
jgi:hypothetical protein